MTENQNTKLQATPTIIPDVLVLEPKVFGDNRGWFTESFNANDFAKATRLDVDFAGITLSDQAHPRQVG